MARPQNSAQKTKPTAAVSAVGVDVKTAPVGASRTGDTVTVGCKLPWGLVLRGMRKATRQVPVLGGGMREETYFPPDGREVLVYGNARAIGEDPKTRIVFGVAMTSGIPKDLWEQWLHDNRDLPAIQNGLVFACPTVEDVASEARGQRKQLSGLEPLRVDNDPRRPKSTRPEIKDIGFDAEAGKNTKFAELDVE